ncbi:hypothetical protein BKA61DRAFT_636753 [Leptodontidium sp. MPI-SDFR-AT-0119]|nr:hypothetical protein BKA61DRAFT_636753 [Leptodontidium sp. MPI-SDFR-AT-0119]
MISLLPRRHAQRRTLYHGRHKTPPLDLSTPTVTLDSEAEHYRKIRAEFVVAGPNLANPCDETKAMMKREEQMWKLKNSRIKRQATMSTYWHRYMDEGIMADLRNWILTLRLDDLEVEKSALYVRDQEKFPHERLRVQESPINIFAGCTSTRPAALVGKIPLLYEDIEFQVFPPLIKGRRPTVRLILNLQHIKRSGGKKKP